MVPYMGELLTGDSGHSLNNFKIAAGLKEGKHRGMHWHDGDFYKYMEAAMYVYAQNKDEKIIEELDKYIEIIGKAQEENSYLQTQIKLKGLEPFSNRRYHVMYNSGHLYTSACVHHRVTGKTNFLEIAIKHADNLYETFQPQPKELARFGFNQTQIMGLAELYREAKDERYLELAGIFINMRGKSPVEPDLTVRFKMIGDMTQERTALREEREAVGHTVLALYFYAGAAYFYAETGEQALVDALGRLWDNVVQKKKYITGACGRWPDVRESLLSAGQLQSLPGQSYDRCPPGGYALHENQEIFKENKKDMVEKYGEAAKYSLGMGPAFDCADVPDQKYIDGYNTDLAIATLKDLLENGDKRFFLGLGFKNPHLNWLSQKNTGI